MEESQNSKPKQQRFWRQRPQDYDPRGVASLANSINGIQQFYAGGVQMVCKERVDEA